MQTGRTTLAMVLSLSLAACGGGGGGGNTAAAPTPTPTATGTPTPTPSSAACTLRQRQDFAFAVIDEWYLFPDLVDRSLNPAGFATVQDYIDALVAPARAESKDRFFTYITSIAEEEAFFNSGSSAGFGTRLGYDTTNNRVFVIEAFETAPAFGAGFDRGTEILAIGPNAANAQTVANLMASGGPQAVIDALGPSDTGVTRYFRIRSAGGTEREVTISKADYPLDPISDRNGVQVFNDNGKSVGYVNLRTFISTANQDLRDAFATFRSQGVTEVIVDLRYNGGGLVSTAELFGDLLGGGNVGDIYSFTTFRDSKAQFNETKRFASQPQSIAATKIAFIGRAGTASASELVTNAFIPYLGNNMALVGSNTFGKPVGQIALDEAACDDRMRVVAFKTENADRQGEYFTGLASVVPNTCRAQDDIFTPLGDPNEASISAALDFLAGRPCSPISGESTQRTASIDRVGSATFNRQQLLQPEQPTPAQREVPGLF